MNTCSVCLNDISFNDICNTNCNHDFCEKCLDEWFKRNKTTCPLCRGIITYYKKSDTITKLYFDSLSKINACDLISASSEILNVSTLV